MATANAVDIAEIPLGIMLRSIGARMPRKQGSEGSLSKSEQKPQYWLGQWHVWVDGKRKHRGPRTVVDEDGNRLLCSKIGKKEAAEHLRRMVREDRAAGGVQIIEPVETFGSCWGRFIASHSSGWARSTKTALECIFNKHVLPAIGTVPLRDLTREMLQARLDALATSGFSRSMTGKVRTWTKAALEDAVEDEHISKNPARKLRIPKYTKKTAQPYLTPDACEKLLNQCVVEGRAREHLIIRICLTLGPRRGEVFALRRNDVEPGRIRVDESAQWDAAVGDPKTAISSAWLPLPPSLEVELRSWMDRNPGAPDDFLFPQVARNGLLKPYRPANYLRRVLQPLAARAEIGTKVNFQTLRRTTATLGQRHGSVKDVQAVLRHASPAMTIGTYMQPIPDGVRATVQALDSEVCGGKVN